jgi:hypothetical protein
MSIKIHRATGYGMPWATFQKLAKFTAGATVDPDESRSFYEQFKEKFDTLTGEQLFMTKEERRLRPQHSPYSLEPHLLAKSLTMGGRESPEFGRSEALYQLVMNPDFITDIIFFPNMIYANSWYRSDSTLDYMFERFGQGVDVHDSSDFTRYIRHGVYPYDKFLVDKDGTPLCYEDYCLDYQDAESGIRGAIPHEIRWYLTKFGFLDDAGVDELRPVVAQWWC